MKKSMAAVLMALTVAGAWAEKRSLTHEDFDHWQEARNQALSRNGEWAAYTVTPQDGDGTLYFRNVRNGRSVTVARGYRPRFTANGEWALAQIKPLYEQTRKAKIAKKKDLDLPQDSLAIVNLRTLTVSKVPGVLSYKVAPEGGVWAAWQSCDTTYTKLAALKDKEAGKPLVVRNLVTGTEKVVKNVDKWMFDRSGDKLALTVRKSKKDTLTTNSVGVLILPDTSYVVLDRDHKYYSNLQLSRDGSKLAFACTNDSNESGTRTMKVFLSDLHHNMESPRQIILDYKGKHGEALRPNQYTKLEFSHNSNRLIAGVAPVIAPDDSTIYDFETGKLDIWRWDAPVTPPQEEKNIDKIREASLPVVIELSNGRQTLVSDDIAETVDPGNRWDGDWALVADPAEFAVSRQWDYTAPNRYELVSLVSPERRDLGVIRGESRVELSDDARYVTWFADRNWHAYDIATSNVANISAEVSAEMWNTMDDYPVAPDSWGKAGWTKNDGRFLVYDKYDIWSLDPKGKDKPENLTLGQGAKRGVRIRYYNLDPERTFLSDGDLMPLALYDYKDHYQGLGWMKYGKPSAPHFSVLDGHSYRQIIKAENKLVFSWTRGNFSEIPEVWLCDGTDFTKARKVTGVNDQLKDYKWGTARLVKWNAYDGKPSEGVLYVPEDLDTSKKYPMLCVFYETHTENLYDHYKMEPSWSWVNYPFYVSRDYVVFVPDIHYTSGRPGEDAYNYVCSGAEEMCRSYPWIDKDRIGIDGQSWGGYQTAFLITRTNMFACAGSGAPVSNMTSAYGGIRWESGSSRQAQYEQGQSRIGGTLWDKTNEYIANSPVFFADRVNTPLLIMHNDADGAVPWYQGIEYFMDLRRLGKPVWMLQYNGEAHNIRARKNRKDITRRLQQFFDHYLKGDPMPKWMKEGVPVIRKGQEFGFELENND